MKILNVNEDIDLSFKWGKVSQLYATLTLGSQLSVKCKGPWGWKSMFKGETHFHKMGESAKDGA
jgi:hypothetical protein